MLHNRKRPYTVFKTQGERNRNRIHYTRLIFSTPFRHSEHMDMPEPWVILIFVELFWSGALSYFAENAWFVSFHINFRAPSVIFPRIYPKICWQLELFSKKAFKSLSYFQNLELFLPKNPWVIFEMSKK